MVTVVAKIGSSSITAEDGTVDRAAVEKLAGEVADVRAAGHNVVVVTSGAVAAGRPALGMALGGVVDTVTLQAVSAVGQSRLMRVWDDVLAGHGLVGGQVLIAPLDFMERSQYLHARATLERLLTLGVFKALARAGAAAGDVVRVARFEFDYEPDDEYEGRR